MLESLRQKRPGTPLRRLLFYVFVRGCVRVLFNMFYRLRVYGHGRMPTQGAVLIVANHQSYLDPPAIGVSICSRHLDFVARLGLFESSRLFAGAIAALNSLPIKEEGGDAAAIKEVLRRLDAGRAVLIFPEGTRSEDGAMHEFKRGVAVLVKRARCPVLPMAVEGCYDAWPRGTGFPRLFGARVAVAVGRPITHEELMKGTADEALVLLAQRVDHMRRALRAKLRRSSRGRFPAAGAGDQAFTQAGSGPRSGPRSEGALRTT
jgi:1-acyl-sn-glycerol-3-phosphate acyltransferase